MDLSAIMNTNEHGSKTDGPKDTQNTAVTRSPSPKKTNDGQTSQQDETTAGTSNVSNTIKGLLHLPKANHAEIEASTSNTQAVNSKPILPSFRRTHAAPPNPTIATASTSNIHTSPKSQPPPTSSSTTDELELQVPNQLIKTFKPKEEYNCLVNSHHHFGAYYPRRSPDTIPEKGYEPRELMVFEHDHEVTGLHVPPECHRLKIEIPEDAQKGTYVVTSISDNKKRNITRPRTAGPRFYAAQLGNLVAILRPPMGARSDMLIQRADTGETLTTLEKQKPLKLSRFCGPCPQGVDLVDVFVLFIVVELMERRESKGKGKSGVHRILEGFMDAVVEVRTGGGKKRKRKAKAEEGNRDGEGEKEVKKPKRAKKAKKEKGEGETRSEAGQGEEERGGSS